ncbi:MAG: sigma-54 dependent transcriptional regulator [Pseudomonadota bacterium]
MNDNLAACVEYSEIPEIPRAPASVVNVKESGFWLGSAYPASPVEAESRSVSSVPDSTPPPAPPVLHTPRKVANASPAMRRVFELLNPLARAEVTVTLTGETGTGKDVLARTVHERSSRQEGPFVVFDCGAVAANLAESELLGHERGAFTGAVSTHRGAFERATGGTLFLDEIGELPLDLQTRLLRVLSNSSVRRVGGTRDLPVDVRVIAATNRDLLAEVAAGRFRQDLYFRLATAVVHVPPLRDRIEDIPVLVARLLEDLDRGEVEISRGAIELLSSRRWPGNVRELKNSLAFALAFLDGPVLEARHLVMPTIPETKADLTQLPLGGIKLESIERVAIEQTLGQTNGNKARAAQILGIAPSTLYEKLKKYQQASDR